MILPQGKKWLWGFPGGMIAFTHLLTWLDPPLRTRKVCVGGGCVSRAGVVPTGYFQSGSERKVGPKEVKMASGS